MLRMLCPQDHSREAEAAGTARFRRGQHFMLVWPLSSSRGRVMRWGAGSESGDLGWNMDTQDFVVHVQ